MYIYVYVYIYIHTHTHTYIHIYIYIVCVYNMCVCVCVCVCIKKYRDEALVQSAIAFLGDSLNEAVGHRGIDRRLIYGLGVRVWGLGSGPVSKVCVEKCHSERDLRF